MKILYVYSNCSNSYYSNLFSDSSAMILQQAQKYHGLLIDGLSQIGEEITCISGLPINRSLTRNFYIKGGKELINNVKYHYFSTFNFGLIRRIQLLLKSFFYILFHSDMKVVVCDILNISIVMGTLLAARLKRLPVIGIVTDVPGHLADQGNFSFSEKINEILMEKFDGYIFLTQAMNKIVNQRKSPYIVLEGHVDYKMQLKKNNLDEKNNPKVLMYAGSLKKIYGIQLLSEAFARINLSDWEFHVYGDGDYREELQRLCQKYPSIKYMGVKLNNEIVQAEIRASLLVNPRPTNEEYTKYSFPSKNMEYMASGTPILTTRLPGIPEEYYPYVYLLDDESVEGMSKTLKEVLALSKTELHKKGMAAKNFVLNEKNNIVQAGKISHFLKQFAD